MLKSSLLAGILTEPIDGIDSTLENTLGMVSKYIFSVVPKLLTLRMHKLPSTGFQVS